jgi:hypothetical protein
MPTLGAVRTVQLKEMLFAILCVEKVFIIVPQSAVQHQMGVLPAGFVTLCDLLHLNITNFRDQKFILKTE